MALKLTMTCGPYDRARALIDGTVKPEGIDLEVYVNKDPGRHTKIDGEEFDIRRVLHRPLRRRLALPLSRLYGHSHFRQADVPPFLHLHQQAAGIRSLADLNGKRIGVQNWLTTTAVWARGLLEDEYGLDQKSVSWIADHFECGRLETSGLAPARARSGGPNPVRSPRRR